MSISKDWIPMRWAGGPLEVARRRNEKGFTVELRDLLMQWHQPSALAVLKGSPVNCLVANWAAGLPEDAGQQAGLAPLVKAAREMAIDVVGSVSGAADAGAEAGRARQAGLAGIVAAKPAGTDCIALTGRSSTVWDAAGPILAVEDAVWPAVKAGTGGVDDANAGPTRAAWIDSNLWYLQLAAAQNPAKQVWLMFQPPAEGNVVTADAYRRAIADTEAGGARWVVDLDDALRRGIASGSAPAKETWSAICGALRFFAAHREWTALPPAAAIGVVSDFKGDNEFFAGEVLNLLTRRNLSYRVIPAARAGAAAFRGLKAVIAMDPGTPAPTRAALRAFAAGGGLVIGGREWAGTGTPGRGFANPRFETRAIGKGGVAVSREETPDPYLVARDAHILLGRAHDLYRFFNATTALATYGAAPGHARAVFQTVSFAARDSRDVVTIWFSRSYRAATLRSLESPEAVAIRLAPEQRGVAACLPSMGSCAALELTS